MSTDVVPEGVRLIDRWRLAKKSLERAKADVNTAECEMGNATNALGKWLTPHDAKDGETFCIWHGDFLLQVEIARSGTYKVSVRTRGKHAIEAGLA